MKASDSTSKALWYNKQYEKIISELHMGDSTGGHGIFPLVTTKIALVQELFGVTSFV